MLFLKLPSKIKVLISRAIIATVLISILVPIAYNMLFNNQNISFIAFLVTASTCFLVLFSISIALFVYAVLYYRCKNCTKYWSILPKGSVLLNKYQYKENNYLIEISEILDESYCTKCGYIYREHYNRIFKKYIPKNAKNS